MSSCCCCSKTAQDVEEKKSVDEHDDSIVYVDSDPIPPADGSGTLSMANTNLSSTAQWQWNIAVYEGNGDMITTIILLAVLHK